MQIKKVLEYCGDFLGCWLRLLICPHVAAMYIHRYGFKFTTLRDFLFSQPCTNDITTFSFISSPRALSPDFTEWLTWAVTGKEQEGSLGLCILQSSTSAAWPLDLPGQTPLCLYSILQCCSPSWAPLTGAALFPLHPACRAEEFRGIQVGLYQLWGSQLGAALCRCLPGPCCESSESAALPPTSLLRQCLQPVLPVWLFSSCICDVGESWGIGKDIEEVDLIAFV